MKEVSPNELEEAIQDILYEFSADVRQSITVASRNVANECVKRLKSSSPRSTGSASSSKFGHYADNWKSVKEGQGYTVYNDKTYRLTHLLEHGHAKRNGGRAEAIPHIKPVEDFAAEELPNALEKELSK